MIKSVKKHDEPTVFVVDPDPATGNTVQELLAGSHMHCETFRTGRDFLAAYRGGRPGCIVLEQRIPDMSGLQLQHRLVAAGMRIPLVFVISSPDVSTAVELMRGGALHVLEKPARSIELFTAIQEAIEIDRARFSAYEHHISIKRLTDALTPKERQILELIADGKSPKQIAAELQRSVRAVELRRKKLMQKLRVRSTLELMRISVMASQKSSAQAEFASSVPMLAHA